MKDRILDKIIRFDKLLGLTALTVAFVAAFFSVYGIATLFAGAFTLTALMASSLEVGKLVSVTFLYRYWNKTRGFLKTYLSLAVIVLMLITSLGIFGYLSAAYQKSSLEFKANQEKITLIEGQKTYLVDKINQSKSRIQTLNDMRRVQEIRLNEGMTNAFLSRNPLQLKELQAQTVDMIKSADENIKTEQDRIQATTDNIQKIDQQVNDMKFSSAGKKDIRTFQFVAEQFGTSLDKVAKWFIFTLIFVFDPLAVALILAYNVVAYKKEELSKTEFPTYSPSPLAEVKAHWVTQSLENEKIVDLPPNVVTNLTSSASIPSSVLPSQKDDRPAPRPNWL
jgi:hypothetical protein